MSHNPTPPATPELPIDQVRFLLKDPDIKDIVGPELLAWMQGQDELAAWRAEEKKRDDFVEEIRNSIYWNDQELDERAIRRLFERTVSAAKNGEL